LRIIVNLFKNEKNQSCTGQRDPQATEQSRDRRKMEEAGVTTGEANDPQSKTTGITITVKFSGRSIPVTLSPDATIGDLKSLLQPLTNVLPRGQKLIFKGKLLVDTTTLRASEVTGGAKVMLMASQGLHQGVNSNSQTFLLYFLFGSREKNEGKENDCSINVEFFCMIV